MFSFTRFCLQVLADLNEIIRRLKRNVILTIAIERSVSSIHGIRTTGTALSIVKRVLLVNNPQRIVFYRRTTLGLKPSFCRSLAIVSASFSVQKAPTKSLILFLVALFGRL
jgi:hypothetical protein